jgi:hypothetical protein
VVRNQRNKGGTNIIIVCLAHLQATFAAATTNFITVADNIAKSMATSPLTPVPAKVTLHFVVLRKIVPRPNKLDRLYRGMGLPAEKQDQRTGPLNISRTKVPIVNKEEKDEIGKLTSATRKPHCATGIPES